MAPTDPLVPVVCDAGPLIHLDELDALDLLRDFPAVLVPDQVWVEVEHHRPHALQGQLALERLVIDLSTGPEFQTFVRAFSLDIGEQDALACMAEHPHAILLTDDAAARFAARTLRYRTHGTIGILLRAVRRGQRTRDEVLGLLRELPTKSSLHIRHSLLRETIEELERT